MKHIFILIATFLLFSGCGHTKTENVNYRLERKYLLYDANSYIGLHENKHRQTLRDELGIDPVYTEWCAAFVNMILKQNNYPTSETVSDHPLTARSFLKLGVPVVDEPKYGDIIVFKRGEPWQGHVAFYVNKKTVNGIDYYYVLGGNQSDAVTIEPYAASRVISIRRL
mgnify:CR=1 FL=1